MTAASVVDDVFDLDLETIVELAPDGVVRDDIMAGQTASGCMPTLISWGTCGETCGGVTGHPCAC
ncbi:hypothetical protein [Fodinicola acaciae]|uniref:hypothetical protein n=1 Tax=Fodinicola acaciae TaxID=2681555 RepID=UPI0013D6A0A7|nr:hypothetical protein [Fodinicola acaciae]